MKPLLENIDSILAGIPANSVLRAHVAFLHDRIQALEKETVNLKEKITKLKKQKIELAKKVAELAAALTEKNKKMDESDKKIKETERHGNGSIENRAPQNAEYKRFLHNNTEFVINPDSGDVIAVCCPACHNPASSFAEDPHVSFYCARCRWRSPVSPAHIKRAEFKDDLLSAARRSKNS